MKTMNEQFLEIKTKIKERERLNRLLEKSLNEKLVLQDKKDTLYEKLVKEQLDIKKLEGISVGNLVHIIMGDKEQKLRKEKEEVLAAKLKYDAVIAELEGMDRDIAYIKNKHQQFKNLDTDYAQLLREEEERIHGAGKEEAARLREISEMQSKILGDEKEIQEALQAGMELMSSLERVQDSLRSARNWGLWDTFGGGFISTMAKHSKIDDARNEINRAQYLLNRFHRELGDVGESIHATIEIGSFLTFADYFFDGLFADLTVQSRIRDAQNRVEDTMNKVNTIMHDMRRKQEEGKKHYEDLQRKRIGIIENE